MVATPVQNPTLSVTHGTDGAKIASGRTEPGATKWQVYSSEGIYVDVDTTAAQFTKTPIYVTSIVGDSQHWNTTGASSAYSATATGFRIYIRRADGSALTPAQANGSKWHINWIGIEPSSAQGSGTSTQTSSTTTQKTQPPAAGKYYKLVNKNSGKYLDVAGGSTENAANIMQYSKKDVTNQQWLLENAGDGHYFLVAKHSGKVLNVAGGGSADGANVIQYDKGNNDNSKWRLEDAGEGYFYIIGKESGKALEVVGGGTADGDNVQQWTLNKGNNQKWKFEAV